MAASISLAVITLFIVFLSPVLSTTHGDEHDSEDIFPSDIQVCWLREDQNWSVVKSDQSKLTIFCHRGDEKKLLKLWRHVSMQIRISSDEFKLFMGSNRSVVYKKYQESELTWFNFKKLMPWKTDSISLEPFNNCCLGVYTKEPYTVTVQVKEAHKLFLLIFLIGIGLFLGADQLSKNIICYYGSGVSVGILASLLIIVFITSRYFPKKYGGYAFLIGGWSFVLYFIQLIWSNLQDILERYSQYVIGYFTVAGLLSFAFCYWRGPVKNPRTLNLIKWTIQLVGLVLVYNSSQIQEVSIFCVSVIVAIYNFPRFIISSVQTSWIRIFPPHIRLLTEEEFLLQGTEETRKALDELRTFCRSPDCDAWKVISRIKTPQRFAQFVEGSPHVTDNELLDYESDSEMPIQPDFTDDESEVEFRLQSE